MSLDPDIDSDIPALLGASAALSLAGVPFRGPIGAARVGYKDGQYLLNPTAHAAQGVAAATWSSPARAKAVLMVESEADGLSEEVMLGAVMFGHEQMQIAIKAINELVAEAGKPKWNWKPRAANAAARRGRRRRTPKPRCPTPTGSPKSRRAATAFREIKAAAIAGAGRRRCAASSRPTHVDN